MSELISNDVLNNTNSLEELYELMPPEFSSYEDYLSQLNSFKDEIRDELPDFTFEELIKIYENRSILNDVLISQYRTKLFLAGIKFEKHGKI